MHLSKSDFKVARTCGTKLYYRKLGYPSSKEGNPYLEFLADGGYMVEAIAKLMFPDGREIGFERGDDAVALTRVALDQENAILFESTVRYGLLLARVDILVKRGNEFRLIEVKAKSFNSKTDGDHPFRGKKGGIDAGWRPYLEDVAFQTHILRSMLPDAKVTPCLCLVDKAKTSSIDTIFRHFQMTPRPQAGTGSGFFRPEVTFTGDLKKLCSEPLLETIDVSDEVDELMGEVRMAAAEFSATLTGTEPIRIPPAIGIKCKGCEYRVGEETKNGFRECWGTRADPDPHLLDLYQIHTLGTKGAVAARLIEEGRCRLLDVPKDELRGANGTRQMIQLEGTRKGQEFIDPELPGIIGKGAYPLHFIDFEASQIAVPYHANMRPYEQVAFQWSCHTIQKPGGDLMHSEWINIEESYPNFEFARSLRNAIGDTGTVFVWSPYERTTLRKIREQMIRYAMQDRDLADWLDEITKDGGRLVDLCELAKAYYFHPEMKGSLSIKKVLPAVWGQSEKVRNHPWFADYLKTQGGRILGPYETLPPLPFGDEEEGELAAVQEGTAAMRTYQEMLYGVRSSDTQFRAASRQSLLNYCRLDTAAMVMIWMHWSGKN